MVRNCAGPPCSPAGAAHTRGLQFRHAGRCFSGIVGTGVTSSLNLFFLPVCVEGSTAFILLPHGGVYIINVAVGGCAVSAHWGRGFEGWPTAGGL